MKEYLVIIIAMTTPEVIYNETNLKKKMRNAFGGTTGVKAQYLK